MRQAFFLITLLSQTAWAQMPVFRNFSLNEGLPQSQVNAFATDRYGYLWVGTRGGGVARFDGKKFEVFGREQGLASDFILTLGTQGNDVLIGTNKGLNYYDGAEVKQVESLKSPVTTITPYSTVGSVLASGNRLYVFRNDHGVENLPFEFNDNEILADAVVRNDTLFVCSDNGLYLFSLKKPYNKAPLYRVGSKTLRNTFVRQIESWKGGILLGTYGDGVFYFKKGQTDRFSSVSRDEASIITCLRVVNENELYIGTQDKGCVVITPSGKRTFTKKTGLCSDHILSIHSDRWKTIWLGSSGQGFSLYRQHPVTRIGNETDPGAVVYSIFPMKPDYLLLSSETKGLYIYTNHKLLRFKGKLKIEESKIRCFVSDKHGNIWIGTDGNGIYMMTASGDNFYHFTAGTNKINGNWVSCLTADTSGNVWAGFSGGGIASLSFDGNLNITKFKKNAGLLGDRITGIYADRDNTIWYACDKGGIGLIYDNQIQNFHYPELSIRHLIPAKDGTAGLLAATPEGIARFNSEGTLTYTYTSKKNEVSSDNVYVLVHGGKDTLFAGQHNGVDMLVMEGSKVKSVIHIARESGFMGMEAVVRSGARDFDGSIWIGTVNGVYRILPKKLEIPGEIPPPVHIRNISILNVPIEKTIYRNDFLLGVQQNTSVLAHTENQLSFEALSVYPQNPDALNYTWRLKGIEEKWGTWQPSARSAYTNLPPGKYELQIKVKNTENLLTNQYTLFTFTIDAPYWQKAWFMILVYGGGFLILLLIFILISYNSRRKIKRKNELLILEKNIVSLRQKALRLQMNPHFIFHSLNGIQNLVINKQEEHARQYISRFSRLMRDMVELASAETITLHSEIESLRNYLELEKLSRDHSFDYSIEVHSDVEDELVMVPPLLLQPLAENSLMHGFRNKKSGGIINIQVSQSNDVITIIIEDNGEGFEEGKKDPSSPGKTSTALKVTRERLDLHYSGRNTFKIENITSDSKTGTRVTITLHPEHR